MAATITRNIFRNFRQTIPNRSLVSLQKGPNIILPLRQHLRPSHSFGKCQLKTPKWVKYATFLGMGTGFGIFLQRKNYSIASDDIVPHVTAAEPDHYDSEASPPSKRLNFIADVVEKAAPSVCYLEIRGPHPFSRQPTTLSNGSGFIIREDGLILTNAHVVAPKRNHNLKLKVVLGDGRKFDGVIQAFDPITDLATVKIQATGLPVLKLGSSSDIRPGEWVVAMGSPLSLSNTVTCGIVSSVNRGSKELGIQNKDMEYIQTDAVINFGNSGGPLVNLDGEAIGINTMKVTTGISFAIPSDYARQFLGKAEILEKRTAAKGRGWFGSQTPSQPKRRYMGVTMLTLTPSIASELQSRMDFPSIDSGVLVHKVVIGSPAYHGGVRPGDVIVKVNGNSIESATDIYKAVDSSQDLEMTILRGEKTVTLTVEPEEVE